MRRPVFDLPNAPPPSSSLREAHAPPTSPPAPSALSGIERVLAPLAKRYVLYYPVLREITGSAKAAIMLSQMLYWTRKYLTDRPERGGWFWHTREDWRQSTGLSRHEQEYARARLRACGCVQERLMGAPARMHFRVDLDALGRRIAQVRHRAYPGWRWEDATTLALLGRPIAFLRSFADLTEDVSVTAALYLSELCQQQRAVERAASRGQVLLNAGQREVDAGDNWLDLPLGETAVRLGLSAKRARSARQALQGAGLIEEMSSGGVQPRTFTRVRLQTLVRALTKHASPRPAASARTLPATTGRQNPQKVQQVFDFSGLAETCNPDVPKPANWIGGNVQSRVAETGQLDMPKPANQMAGNGTSIKRSSTQKKFSELPPTPETKDVAPGEGSRRRGFSELTNPQTLAEHSGVAPHTQGSCLILPEGLQEGERLAALRSLERLRSDLNPQLIADEWAGNLRVPGKVRTPLAYLYGLIERAQLGQFVPAMAFVEERGRARRRQNEAAHQAALQRHPTTIHPHSTQTAREAAPSLVPKAQRSVMPDSFKADMQRLGWGTRKEIHQ